VSWSFGNEPDVDEEWEPTSEDYSVLDDVNNEPDIDSPGIESADRSVSQTSAIKQIPIEHVVESPVLGTAPTATTDEVQDSFAPDGPVIGRVSATERSPSCSEEFQFWMGPDEVVNPFDVVEVEHMRGSTTFGLVTNIEHITDAPSHMSNFVSMDFGDVNTEEQTPRTRVNIAAVKVMANDSDHDDQGVYMPVQSGSVCRFASQDGILRALGIDKIPLERRVPAGLISLSNGTSAPVYLDAAFVLGPESAHINITGISGLATKTSYAMFIIQSMLQTVGADDVAVICNHAQCEARRPTACPQTQSRLDRVRPEGMGTTSVAPAAIRARQLSVATGKENNGADRQLPWNPSSTTPTVCVRAARRCWNSRPARARDRELTPYSRLHRHDGFNG
jgi:hypothetical protein